MDFIGKMTIRKYIFVAIILCVFLFLFSKFNSSGNNWNKNREKILLICLDGATWTLMDPLIEKGELPNFAKLIKNGVHGRLFSDSAFSPPSWTSIATGKIEEKHGIHNFNDAAKRKVRCIWNILGDFNIKVGVVNWSMALPEKINGFIYQPIEFWYGIYKTPSTYPGNIEQEVRKSIDMTELPTYELVEAYKYFNSLDKNIINISTYLIEKHQPSFLAVGFLGTNPYQHRYWSALEPEYFDITFEEVKEKSSVITDYYKKIDEFLHYFIENNYMIIFVSDHGFCRNDIRSGPRIVKYHRLNSDMQHINFLINRVLETIGLLIFVPKPEKGGQIDFSKSHAYFYNNIHSGVNGIKINRAIVPETEIIGLRKRIYLLLKEAQFENGEKVFVDIKENISDDRVDLPDVTFKLNPILKEENISFKVDKEEPFHLIFTGLLNKDEETLTEITLEGKEYVLGDFIDFSRDGVHEQDGVIIMAGKNIKKDILIEDSTLLDVTPTMLYLLGLPVAKDMDGRVLTEAISPGFIEKHQVKYIDTYEMNSIKTATDEGSKIEIIKERLHSLGYAQ